MSVWRAAVVTLYPGMFPGPLGASVAGRALADGRWSLDAYDLRDFGIGRHATVDDRPAGGGPGMILRADVAARALDALRAALGDETPVILPSPRGTPFTQAAARDLASGDGVAFFCGRFEGVDDRIVDAFGLREVSVGDYVLSGGEPAALTMLDAIVRLLPGVMGRPSSADDESFSNGLLEYPQYTRPADWEGRRIPSVLSSGDHGRVAAWRRAQSERLTAERRPDLWNAFRAAAAEHADKG